ncbi:MAG TPA: hypothetical protein VHD59_09175 [Pseudolabrys sp.]|jgi:hypothetical protein|nr:hypothetical protein [Pseudolabrys sp.]
MAFASHALSPSDTSLTAATPKPSFIVRLFRAMHEARMRQAEREIAAYLARTGGKFTDSAEREIEQRFLSRN